MDVDLKNSLTYATLAAAISVATNNTNFGVVDTQGYVGQLAVIINGGKLSAGDTNAVFSVLIQASATNNASNATNLAGNAWALNSAGNNTAFAGVIPFDVRAEHRYLFARVTIVGGNSPAAPIAITTVGKKQIEV